MIPRYDQLLSTPVTRDTGSGWWRDADEAVAACVRPRGRVDPEPRWVGAYREQGERFRALYPALRDTP